MTAMIIAFIVVAFGVSCVATVFVKQFAIKRGLIDKPCGPRKIHTRNTARFGGASIYFSFSLLVIILLLSNNSLTSGRISTMHYIGVLLGGFILMIGGYIDDRFNLPPKFSIIAPVFAAVCVILFGVEIDKLTNPFGGVIFLAQWQSNVLVFTWLLIVMYTTKFLDGLDGLATSVSLVGALMIMFLSLTVAYYQSDVALLSAIAIGSLAGFLFWNIHPAKIFLGEGGSTFVGFLLGTLAVISGGKLATALLVLGIPLLDVVWIIVRRFKQGGIRQIFQADRKHLHHRLLKLGWGQHMIVLLYVALATAFGISTIFLQSREKLVALSLLVVLMLLSIVFFVYHERYEGKNI